jgi:hypothetical protein
MTIDRQIHPDITLGRVVEAVEADDNLGFCNSCGCDADGCEPDACNYTCESCGQREVYGAEEYLFRMAS